jgi:hypothetical protein
LILGANGHLARSTTRVFLKNSDAQLTLYFRRANRLENSNPKRVTIVEGDVLDRPTLEAAMSGNDVVYANLAGAMKQQAERIVEYRELRVERTIRASAKIIPLPRCKLRYAANCERISLQVVSRTARLGSTQPICPDIPAAKHAPRSSRSKSRYLSPSERPPIAVSAALAQAT